MNDYYTLAFLQGFVKDTEERKGHINDSIKTKLMILIEEFGELAKALRIFLRMRIHDKTAKHNLSDEFGDVLFLVIAIANRCDINLTDALVDKINKDEKKVYKPAEEVD